GQGQRGPGAGPGRPAGRLRRHPRGTRRRHSHRTAGGRAMSWLTPELMDVLVAVLKAIVILLVVVVCGALLSFIERRLLGWWQDRYGPNRVGPFGMFQIAADMIKMFFKEDWTPPFADKFIFMIAPMIAFAAMLMAFAIIPVTPTWGVADLN